MKKQLKDAWVRALRGGQYKQAKRTLRDTKTGGWYSDEAEVSYCCLGVLCDIYSPFAWSPEGPQHAIGTGGALTDEGLRVTGLTHEQQNVLIQLNDAGNLPFNLIADVIDAFATEEDVAA